jgi:hypothetical protein
VFCRSIIECRDHLFLECGFSKRIWGETSKKCLVLDPPIEWEEIMSQGIRKWRNKSLRANAVSWFGVQHV